MIDKRIEQAVKDKLWELWKKEAVRVKKLPNGWIEKRVTLGKGILKNQGTAKVDKMMDAIVDFGIDLSRLGAMNPDYDELNEIYQAILGYRRAIRFLKNLKDHMETFQNFKEWRNN